MASKMSASVKNKASNAPRTTSGLSTAGTPGVVPSNFEFEEIPVSAMDARRRRDLTDYGPLFERLKSTTPGQALKFGVPEGMDAKKFRDRIAQVIKRENLEESTGRVFRTHLSKDAKSIQIAVALQKSG